MNGSLACPISSHPFPPNPQCLVHVFPYFPSPHCSFFSFPVLALEQSPDMVIKEGQSVKVECSKKKSNSRAMYWYMLPSEKNSSLTLLASATQVGNAAVEKGFENHFKSSNIKGDSITLSIDRAFLNDSGTYFCAESEHSGETAEGAEHKLLPAQTGPAFHLMGAAGGRGISSHSLAPLLPSLPFLLFSDAESLFVLPSLLPIPGLPPHLTLTCNTLNFCQRFFSSLPPFPSPPCCFCLQSALHWLPLP